MYAFIINIQIWIYVLEVNNTISNGMYGFNFICDSSDVLFQSTQECRQKYCCIDSSFSPKDTRI
jgi:hypothetical protein